jgi:glycosyltransferase involved in cell wall biosynthesis
LLVPPGDPVALADALIKLLDDPPLANRLGQAARIRVREKFDRENTLTRLLEITGQQKSSNPRENP